MDNDILNIEGQEENESEKQSVSRPWLFKKGQSGNPGGRKKGSKSMKTWVKEMLESMTEDERQEFIAGLSKDIIWKMGEGNPENKTNITGNIETIHTPSAEELALAKQLLEQRSKRISPES